MTRSEIIEIVFNELQEKFASKAQQRFLYSQKPKVAKKLASKMTKKDYKELPNKVEEDFPKQYADAFAKATGNRYDYNIEVSVANSAREAMQIYKDGRWEGDGIIQTSTNTYGSNDEDSMYGFLDTLKDQGVEIVTHDLEESALGGQLAGDSAESLKDELKQYVKGIIKQPNSKVTYLHLKSASAGKKVVTLLKKIYGIESKVDTHMFSPSPTVKFDNDQMLESVNEATIKGTYAGRPVVINKKGSDMSKWTVTFTKTKKTVPIADVIANLKDDKGRRFSESVNESDKMRIKMPRMYVDDEKGNMKIAVQKALEKYMKLKADDHEFLDAEGEFDIDAGYDVGVHGTKIPQEKMVDDLNKMLEKLGLNAVVTAGEHFSDDQVDQKYYEVLVRMNESVNMTKSHLKQIIKEELVNVLNETSYAQTLYQTKDLIKQFKAFMFNKFDRSDPIWCDQDKLKMFFKVFKDQVTKETKPTCD